MSGMWRGVPEGSGRFIGRKSELDAVARALSLARLVTLTGSGGIGKSRLALGVVNRLEDGAVDGVCWAGLSSLQDASVLTATVAGALGLADHSLRPSLEGVCRWVGGRRLLLVLDSCEHVVAACRNLVTGLLAVCPELMILATSREALGVEGEQVCEIGPLPLESDALELLCDRAAVAGRTLDLPGEREQARVLCRRLEGVPLALELAAAQLPFWSVDEVARQVGQHVDTADVRPPGLWRHRALRMTVGWSHELCTGAERLLWARMSVFRGPADEASVREVCLGGPLDAPTLAQALAGLVRKSVVTRQQLHYRMLDTIREYGNMWLRELGEDEVTARRHARHYTAVVRRADTSWFSAHQVQGYQVLAQAHSDLCAALNHHLADEPTAAVELAGRLGFHWACCGHLREAGSYLKTALQYAPGSSPARTRALWAWGVVRALQGDHRGASLVAGECGRAAQRGHDSDGVLRAAYLAGLVHLLQGRPRAALDEAERALEGGEGSLGPRMMCCLVQVFALTAAGSLKEARARAERLLGVCRHHGDYWMRAYLEYQLAVICLFENQARAAAVHAQHMLAAKRGIGDSFGIALGLDVLAAALAALGQGQRAVTAYGAAHSFWRAVGHPQRGTPELAPVRAQFERTTRTLLGDQAYEEKFADAASMDPAVVLADILRAGPSPEAPRGRFPA